MIQVQVNPNNPSSLVYCITYFDTLLGRENYLITTHKDLFDKKRIISNKYPSEIKVYEINIEVKQI